MSDGIIEVRSLNCNLDEKLCQSLHNLNYSFSRSLNTLPHLSHDSNRSFSSGLSNAVLHQVKHVLVVKKANKVEGAEAGCTAQSQISDHHGATREGKMSRQGALQAKERFQKHHVVGGLYWKRERRRVNHTDL